MKQIILVHGVPSEEEFFDKSVPSPAMSHWFPWFIRTAKELEFSVSALDYPRAYDPVYEEWEKVFETQEIDQDILDSMSVIQKSLPLARIYPFKDRGHFCDENIPEVIEIIKNPA